MPMTTAAACCQPSGACRTLAIAFSPHDSAAASPM
jgi:hypothetical protein